MTPEGSLSLVRQETLRPLLFPLLQKCRGVLIVHHERLFVVQEEPGMKASCENLLNVFVPQVFNEHELQVSVQIPHS